MSGPVFSFTEYRKLVGHFTETMPQLLARHPRIAEQAVEIEKLRLGEVLDAQFTVAVVGQMRVGKSTLLNAIIGRDLAPTGVVETTATVNWFRKAPNKEMENLFRVHWRGGTVEDKPLGEVDRWLDREEVAPNTSFLEFFADSRFLDRASIVDTPGTRAAIESDRKATDGFLGERLENETLAHGGRADAVLYVINPVGRESDRDLLQLFGEKTRLPGSSPNNSIAAVQKWETLEPDPLLEVDKKCARLRQQLEGKVAEVIPTSGLLARQACLQPQEIWDRVTHLATESDAKPVKRLLDSPEFFVDPMAGLALDAEERKLLRKTVPWPVLRLSVMIAESKRISSGILLRAALHEASGIDRLRSLLEDRFFALAGLIKANTILRKAWDPCNVAILKLEELERQRAGDERLGERAMLTVRAVADKMPAMDDVAAYVENTMEAVRSDMRQARILRRELSEQQTRIRESFDALEADVKALELLGNTSEIELEEVEKRELRLLFGGRGEQAWQRLGLDRIPDDIGDVVRHAETRHAYWNGLRSRKLSKTRTICEWAVDRLDQVLEALEAAVEEKKQ